MHDINIPIQASCTHTEHLFSHPLCEAQSLLRRIGNVAIHVFTFCLPLTIYHMISCCYSRTASPQTGNLQPVGIASVQQTKSDHASSNVDQETLDFAKKQVEEEHPEEMIPVQQNRSLDAYFPLGQEALDFARDKLKEHPEITSPQFNVNSRGPSKTHQPTNPEITCLTSLYLNYIHRNFEDLMEQNPIDPWKDQEVINAADECMKIAYAISNLALDDLKAFTTARAAQGDNITYAKALTEKNSYQYHTFFYCTEVYHLLRGEFTWGTNPRHNVEEFIPPQSISDNHAKAFYQKGTIQNTWNELYNDYCDRIRLYVDEKELKLADKRYVKWTQKDTGVQSFVCIPGPQPVQVETYSKPFYFSVDLP